jgi:hypothetical protein
MGARSGLIATGGIRFGVVCAAVAFVAACTSSGVKEPPVDPDAVRADISKRLPASAKNRDGWAIDIFAAFEALSIKPTPQNICGVVAVTEQESTFQVNPPVPGLPEIARNEIDARAASYNIPRMVVTAALGMRSSNGATYTERIKNVKTEQELSEIFEDFIGMVPLGERLFGSFNPVRTGGPMQVSIAFAEEHARQKRYPYPISSRVIMRAATPRFRMRSVRCHESRWRSMAICSFMARPSRAGPSLRSGASPPGWNWTRTTFAGTWSAGGSRNSKTPDSTNESSRSPAACRAQWFRTFG